MSNQLHQSNNYSNQAGGQPASPRQKKFCVDLGKRSCDVEHWTANQASTYIELMEPAHKQARFQNGEGCANGDDCETLLELIKGCKEAAYELINPEDAVLDVHKMPKSVVKAKIKAYKRHLSLRGPVSEKQTAELLRICAKNNLLSCYVEEPHLQCSASFTISHLKLALGESAKAATPAQLAFYNSLLARTHRRDDPLMPRTKGWLSRCIDEMKRQLGLSNDFMWDQVEQSEIPKEELQRLSYIKDPVDAYQPLIIKVLPPAEIGTPTKINK